MRHHKRSLAKELQRVAEETAKLHKATEKKRRDERRQERRARYGKSAEGVDPRTDPGAGSPTPRVRGAAKEDEEAGEGGRPWDDC